MDNTGVNTQLIRSAPACASCGIETVTLAGMLCHECELPEFWVSTDDEDEQDALEWDRYED